MKKLALLTLLCFATSINAHAQADAKNNVLTALTELRDVKTKLTQVDETGAQVIYLKCNQMIDLCDDMLPTANHLIMALPGDSLKALGVVKYLDIKMMGLQDSLSSVHYSLVGARLPQNDRPINCSASFQLNKDGNWKATKQECRP